MNRSFKGSARSFRPRTLRADRREEGGGGRYTALLREGKISLGRVAGTYLAWAQARGYSPETLRSFSIVMRMFYRDSGLGPEAPLTAVTRSVSERVLARFRSRLAPSTAWHYALTLAALFRSLVAEGVLLENPFAAIDLPPRPRLLPLPTLTHEEMRRLLGAATTLRERAIVEVLYSTGIRIKECAGLEIRDLDLSQGTLWVRGGKGGKDRRVPLGEEARRWVSRHLAEARPPGATALWARHPSAQWIRILIRRLGRRAGIAKRVSPHTLRRTCATHLLEGGASPWVVKEILGHSDLTSLDRYLALDARTLKEMHEKTHPRS